MFKMKRKEAGRAHNRALFKDILYPILSSHFQPYPLELGYEKDLENFPWNLTNPHNPLCHLAFVILGSLLKLPFIDPVTSVFSLHGSMGTYMVTHLSHLASEVTQHHFCSIYWLLSESKASWDSKGGDIYSLMGGMSKKRQTILKNRHTFFHHRLNTHNDVLSAHFFCHHFPILGYQAKVRRLWDQAPCFLPPSMTSPGQEQTQAQKRATHTPQFSGN